MIMGNLLPNVTGWFKRENDQPRRNVMIISDDPEYLQVVSGVLAQVECNLLIPNHVLETLLILDSGEMPDLFICDFKMPQVDGKALIEKMRIRFGRRTMPPIIFMLDSPEDEEMALKLGVDDVLPKSLEPEKFINSLADIVERLNQNQKEQVQDD